MRRRPPLPDDVVERDPGEVRRGLRATDRGGRSRDDLDGDRWSRLHRLARRARAARVRPRRGRARRPVDRPRRLRAGRGAVRPRVGRRPGRGGGRPRRGRTGDGVVHVAAFKYAGTSVSEPLETYRRNVVGTVVLLEMMAPPASPRLVFSGRRGLRHPDGRAGRRGTPHAPESPYGASKDMGERIIATGRARARPARWPRSRCGTSTWWVRRTPTSGTSSPYNLFPAVMRALVAGETPRVFGDGLPDPGRVVRPRLHPRR